MRSTPSQTDTAPNPPTIRCSPMMLLTARLALLLLLVVASPASAQSHVFTFRGQKKNSFGERLGQALAVIGDIDRDGYGDFIIGSPLCGAFSQGGVYLVSGDSGKIIRTFAGGEGGAEFGYAVDGCGDVNGDGFPDYIIGSPGEFGGLGDALVVSGKTGRPMFSVFHDDPCGSPGKACSIGTSVAGVGDVDKDGKPDVAVGAPGTNGGKTYGFVLVYSFSPKRQLLYRLNGTKTFPVGASVAGAGDVDKDGHADVIVVGPTVRIYSGKTGAVLRDVKGDGASGLGDLDGDGYADYAVWGGGTSKIYSGRKHTVIRAVVGGGAAAVAGRIDTDRVPDYLMRFAGGKVRAYSGRRGTLLTTVSGATLAGGVGAGVGAGDINGDGRADVLVGDPAHDGGKGVASVWSVATMSLSTDAHALSIAGRDTQTFHLDGGAANAGRMFWLVGSMSGTSPGITVGAYQLPLNPDTYTHCTLSNPKLISGGVGSLSTAGTATARLRIPPGTSANLVGLVAHHAYVLFSVPLQFHLASNAVPLVLVK